MGNRDKREDPRLDQVDRRSQVTVSRAMRARDVSRPSPEAVAEALDQLDSSGLQRFKPTETPGLAAPGKSTRDEEEALRSPRNE